MHPANRREFLAEVGRGMLVASVGAPLACELGLAHAFAGDTNSALRFGTLEPLVALMQDTPVDRLQPALVEQLAHGTTLRTLIAAGALANARSFGGQHYVGYHTLMALMPAYDMAQQLPAAEQALPVLKVLYRNTDTIQQEGGRSSEVLEEIDDHDHPAPTAERLVDRTRACDMVGAERVFAAMMKQQEASEAYNNLQFIVQDDIDVHRVVLAWRAWDTLRIAGAAHAHTLLRQSVRHCVDVEQRRLDRGKPEPRIRTLLPQLLNRYKLFEKPLGARSAPDGWVDSMARTIFSSTRARAADAAAAALAEGIAPEAVGEAISLAANMLVLYDRGRSQDESPDKPAGSVHGASVGVHASDSANAWRHIARVSNTRNTAASLIVGAYHTAGQHGRVGDVPWAGSDHAKIQAVDPATLLKDAEQAIRDNDQARASTIVARYGTLELPAEPMFGMLIKYGVSEDGALHAEKYYHTVREEFYSTRPAFRWRHVVALARVTASEYGLPAPGMAQARALLGLSPGQSLGS